MDEALISKFIERATEQDAEVMTVGAGTAAEAIGKLARESGLKSFSVAEGTAPAVAEALKAAGLSESTPPSELAVTGASWAVAETGTLVIKGTRRQFITAETHVVVLDGAKMLDNLDDIPFGEETAPFLTLVTGPSRTADIERVLVLGAHGPRRLVVLIEKP